MSRPSSKPAPAESAAESPADPIRGADWAVLALLAAVAVLSGFLEVLLVPLQVGTVYLPVSVVLAIGGNLLQVPDCDYQSPEQVRDELRAAVDAAPQLHHTAQSALLAASAVESLRDMPMYQIDALLRRAPSLQATRIALDGAAEYGP